MGGKKEQIEGGRSKKRFECEKRKGKLPRKLFTE
jgi:hypothetical protein